MQIIYILALNVTKSCNRVVHKNIKQKVHIIWFNFRIKCRNFVERVNDKMILMKVTCQSVLKI